MLLIRATIVLDVAERKLLASFVRSFVRQLWRRESPPLFLLNQLRRRLSRPRARGCNFALAVIYQQAKVGHQGDRGFCRCTHILMNTVNRYSCRRSD